MTTLSDFTIDSPIGPLGAKIVDEQLRGLAFDGRGPAVKGEHAEIVARVRAYFGGDLDALDGVPVDVVGTPFQRAVWSALRDIPVGATVSYRDIADAVGRPSASRAVGNAVGSNPVAVVVPCHRVITTAGGLGGFGGGLDRKRWLLAHEGVEPPSLAR
jgi:methylated-DNA-[protein]-cysteine S-methyltransferase